MSANVPNRPGPERTASDTKRTAPRRLALWIVPLAIVAVAVLLIGVHVTGGIK